MSNAPAGPAVHDNGVARAELALDISTPSATGLSGGLLPVVACHRLRRR